MKNYILGALTSILLIVTIAATVPNQFMTIQPKKPISIFVDWFKITSNLRSKIDELSRQGYVVKSITLNSNNDYLLVMEKY